MSEPVISSNLIDDAIVRDGDLKSMDGPAVPVRSEDDKTMTSRTKRNQDKNTASNTLAARRTRVRKSIYQTEDFVREISPKPETVPDSVDQVDGANDRSLATEGNLLGNILINGKRTVQCNICKRRMTESKLANHIRLLHSESSENKQASSAAKRKDFKCEHCGKSYAIQYTYQQHLRTHIEGRPKCPECGSTFASAFSLFRHRARNHNLQHNYQTHVCDQCDKSFFSASELKLHKQRHSSKREFKCEECKKAFSVKGNLNIHMRTHAKDRIYKCDICESAFSHPYSLVSHRRIHTNEFPFECPDCNKVYRSKHQLTSHRNVHSDARPFKCKDCSKAFKSRTAFKMHQDEHKGIKRFACKFCDRLFQCHANKLKHERRHSGLKRHKCELCDKAFFERQELRTHQKVHERQSLGDQSLVEMRDLKVDDHKRPQSES